jgi:membrane protein YqaA with SNARE-associated domain
MQTLQKLLTKYPNVIFWLPFIVFSTMLYFVSPADIVSWVGVSNSYLFMFIVAFIGGVSIFSGVPYPAILVTLALGGLNPFYLGVSAAFGLFLGDSSSFFLGRKSEGLITGSMKTLLDKILTLYDRFPKMMPLVFFTYGSVSPFPNDVITISAGIKGFPWSKTMPPLALGNLVFCVGVAYFADKLAFLFS